MKTFVQYLREYAQKTLQPWEMLPNPNETNDTEPVTGDNRIPPPDPNAPHPKTGLRPIAGSIPTNNPDPSESDTEKGRGVRWDSKGNLYSRIYNNPDNPAVPPPGTNVWAPTDKFHARDFLEKPFGGAIFKDGKNVPNRREQYSETNPRHQPQRYPHESMDEYRERLNRGATIYNPNPAPGDAPDKFDYDGLGISDKMKQRWQEVEKIQQEEKARKEKARKAPPPAAEPAPSIFPNVA
jgi:hypothetical protein